MLLCLTEAIWWKGVLRKALTSVVMGGEKHSRRVLHGIYYSGPVPYGFIRLWGEY